MRLTVTGHSNPKRGGAREEGASLQGLWVLSGGGRDFCPLETTAVGSRTPMCLGLAKGEARTGQDDTQPCPGRRGPA